MAAQIRWQYSRGLARKLEEPDQARTLSANGAGSCAETPARLTEIYEELCFTKVISLTGRFRQYASQPVAVPSCLAGQERDCSVVPCLLK